MEVINLGEYNLELILLGGQAFNWDKINGKYVGFTQDEIVSLVPRDSKTGEYKVSVEGPAGERAQKGCFDPETYFREDVAHKEVISDLPSGSYLKKAVDTFGRLRILRQGFEQTLFSYILSSANNIKRIRGIVRRMSSTFGERVVWNNSERFLFPSAWQIAEAGESGLMQIGAGFRAKYLWETAKIVARENIGEIIYGMKEQDARDLLVKLPGVGPKIADCVLLYSLGFDGVIPLDVWMQRVFVKWYGLSEKMSYSDMRQWYKEVFGRYAGWAGQYLYEYMRLMS